MRVIYIRLLVSGIALAALAATATLSPASTTPAAAATLHSGL